MVYVRNDRFQNATRTRRSVQSQYNTVCLQRQTLGTTPPTKRGRRATRSWTGTVQNQDKANSMDVLPVDRRPSGLPMMATTMTPITLLTSMHLGLYHIYSVLRFTATETGYTVPIRRILKFSIFKISHSS